VAFTAREQAAPFVEGGVFRKDLAVFEAIEGSSTFTPGDQATARAKCGLFGDPCALWVGRLDANKDPLTVLGAVDRVIARLPGIQLWCLYTDARLLAEVRKRLDASPGLRERVHLLGSVPHDRIQEFYRAADLFVLASHVEGSGFALLEALACGTSPLVTSIPAFRRITGGGQVGELFRTGDAAGLADALARIAGGDRSLMRARARRFFEQSLSYEAIARVWLDIYGHLLART
jgi:glycosyltransferase involved in cell wall biosynthesis